MSNAKKTIVLVNDHPSRDLKGVVLLASELTFRGFNCIITPLNICNHEVWKFTPDLVHLSYLRTNNEHFADKLHSANILYTVLDTEGGVLEDFSVLSRCLPQDKRITENASHFFCWGKRLEEYLVNNHFFKQEKISTTGQPRIDYYHESFHASLANQDISKLEKYFLFNSMFSFSNPRYSTKEDELKNAVRLFNSDFQKMKEQQDKEEQSQKGFIQLTKKVAMLFPDFKIIYRPHPFESEDIYKKEFKNISNIIVTNKGQVDSWILHSEAVIQLKCSTAFESRMLNKPVLLPFWIGDLNGDPRINEISHIFNNEETFLQAINDVSLGQYKLPSDIKIKQSKLIEDIYYIQDGQSHKRVADLISNILKNKENRTSLDKCKQYRSKFSIHPKENIKLKIIKICLRFSLIFPLLVKFGIIEHIAIRKWKKTSKFFDQSDIESVLESLKHTNPKFNKLTISRAMSGHKFNNSFQLKLDD